MRFYLSICLKAKRKTAKTSVRIACLGLDVYHHLLEILE
jgi:hypothetical protein